MSENCLLKLLIEEDFYGCLKAFQTPRSFKGRALSHQIMSNEAFYSAIIGRLNFLDDLDWKVQQMSFPTWAIPDDTARTTLTYIFRATKLRSIMPIISNLPLTAFIVNDIKKYQRD